VIYLVLACLCSVNVMAKSAGHAPLLDNTDTGFIINDGLTDAWFNPTTGGQGFFITVFPETRQLFLAWFTYDTQRPEEGAMATLGEPGHRWLTAQGPYDGDSAELTLFLTSGGVFDAAEPAAETDLAGDGTLRLQFADCTQGTAQYEITSLDITGEIPIQRITGSNVTRCEQLWAEEIPACTRPEPDLSHGPDNPTITNGHTIDPGRLADGGPGPDGIPSIDSPDFIRFPDLFSTEVGGLVAGVKLGSIPKAYPYNILNWHEIVNDSFFDDGTPQPATLSYCPLTGSSMLWLAPVGVSDGTYGVSGLLYNSNLVLYDRESASLWSQMLEQAINGPNVTRIPDRLQVVETTWETWLEMYPDTRLLSENTGYSRDYERYPYGPFREDERLIFEVDNMDDRRLHRKARILGINVGDSSKIYPIAHFSIDVEVINDTVGDMPVVVAGSSRKNFGVVYNRTLEDCTVLEFEPVQNNLPVVMRDNEGNEWDVFGTAVNGPRMGQSLQKTNSYISYFYAWTAFFPGAPIHQ
jgi:hypothetical protein